MKKKISVTLSKIACCILYVLLTAALFLIVPVVERIFTFTNQQALIPWGVGLLYASVPPALAATLFLHRMLLNIGKGVVFCVENIMSLRILAYCCLFIGVLYFAAGFLFYSMFVISFAAFFFFLMLRVIKNVFDTAYELKQENDYTI